MKVIYVCQLSFAALVSCILWGCTSLHPDARKTILDGQNKTQNNRANTLLEPQIEKREVLPPVLNKVTVQQWNEIIDQQGLPQAQYWLGMKYLNGDGVPKNVTNAYLWLGKAASNNYPEAQYQIGALYIKGIGVTQDYSKAMSWFQLAADNGSINGQFDLSIGYGLGASVPKDLKKSFHWMSVAATNGSSMAMTSLAIKYFWGIGTERDLTNSLKWFEKAAGMGNICGQTGLAYYFYMNSRKEEEQKKAFELLHSAANNWYPQAQYFLSICYGKGVGTKKDLVEAYKWATLASDSGYEYGTGLLTVIRDETKLDSSQIGEALQRAKEFTRTNPVIPENVKLLEVVDMVSVAKLLDARKNN